MEVSKNGSKLPIETLQFFFSTVKICRIFMGTNIIYLTVLDSILRHRRLSADDVDVPGYLCVVYHLSVEYDQVNWLVPWFPNDAPRGYLTESYWNSKIISEHGSSMWIIFLCVGSHNIMRSAHSLVQLNPWKGINLQTMYYGSLPTIFCSSINLTIFDRQVINSTQIT